MKKKTVMSIILYVFAVMALLLLVYIFISKNMFRKENIEIVLVVKTIDPSFEFWKMVRAGALFACNEEGIRLTIEGPQQEEDIDTQIGIMEKLLHTRPSAIILAATDYDKLVPVSKKATSEKIPLITVDSGINSDAPASFIATDNVHAGEKAGRKIIDLLKPGSHVVLMNFIKGTSTAIEREKGVKKALLDSKIIIDGVLYCNNIREKATELTLDVFKKNRHLKGIIALNDPSTVGVARAIKKLGQKGKIKIIGFDNSIEEIEYLEEGLIDALVVQKPFNMGYLSVKTAIKSIRSESVAKNIDTGSNVVTLENMYAEENQKLLFPVIKEVPYTRF